MVSSLNYRRRIFLIVISLIFGYQLSAVGTDSHPDNYVRVAIVQNSSSLRIKIKGGYEVIELASNKVLKRSNNLNTTVTAHKGGILLGEIKSGSDKLFIKANDPDAVTIDGRKFKGNIGLIKKNNSYLLVVNHVELEEYIKGILYHEVSHYWPMEALKAQAITCRTYALYQMRENKDKDFDVTSDIYSQVYGGRASERYRTNKVVDETAGQVLTYNGKVFPAFFHATCGGHTEDAAMLWNIDLPPLKGVDCGNCQDSPHFSWHTVMFIGEIRQRLVNAGYNMGMIEEIKILGQDKSGRNTELNIVTAKKEIKISAKDFRNIIGPNVIKSAKFKVSIAGNDAVFAGFGWGHGVGLCQWGVYFMAKDGRSAEEILKYYYPESDVKTIGF